MLNCIFFSLNCFSNLFIYKYPASNVKVIIKHNTFNKYNWQLGQNQISKKYIGIRFTWSVIILIIIKTSIYTIFLENLCKWFFEFFNTNNIVTTHRLTFNKIIKWNQKDSTLFLLNNFSSILNFYFHLSLSFKVVQYFDSYKIN